MRAQGVDEVCPSGIQVIPDADVCGLAADNTSRCCMLTTTSISRAGLRAKSLLKLEVRALPEAFVAAVRIPSEPAEIDLAAENLTS